MQPSPQRLNPQFNSVNVYSPALSEILDRHPLIVAPDTPVVEVLGYMSQAWGSHCQLTSDNYLSLNPATNPHAENSCVLVTKGLRLLGVFTERDVVRLTAEGKNLAQVAIAQVMSQSVHSLKQEEFGDVFGVISLLEQHQIRHLPVVDSLGNLVGVITPSTLRSVLQPANLLKLRTVDEVMNTSVVQAPPDASVLSLAQVMAAQRVSCVVITEDLASSDPIPVSAS